tara:strand:+ start:100 stop:684 length:585 start_codon:yes stop_codon:yes gene_type:complete
MIKTSYFATPYLLDLIDIDTKPLIDYAYKLKETSQGRQSTNLNSWQSFDLDKNESILQHLLNVFTDKCQIMHEDMKLKNKFKQIVDNIWFNINPRGGGNKPHVHSDTIFSGVLYLQCNNESGNLVFPHPAANHVYHFNDDTVEEHNHMNSSFFKTPPQEKKLIIFPSYASHYVEPNNSDSDRISLSFNTKFIEQ